MSQKSTPGPWKITRIEGGFLLTMGTALRRPGNCETHHRIEMDFCLYREDGKQYHEAEANARLMAASPDLLRVCQMILEEIDGGNEMAVIEAAQAAIAKATGGTP